MLIPFSTYVAQIRTQLTVFYVSLLEIYYLIYGISQRWCQSVVKGER